MGATVLDLARLGDTLRCLGQLLDRPQAGALRARLDRGEVPVSALTDDLLRVVYRLAFAALARRRGGLLTDAAALASLRLGVLTPTMLAPDVVATASSALAGVGLAQPGAGFAAELGELHESALERGGVWDPVLGFALGTTKGPGRRTTGSWFTPDPLVDHLLDQALDPVLDEAGDPLTVRVLDPSCGAGTFLVAAARRIARRAGLERPDDRVLRCLRGVDADPAALELARLALWSELVRPGAPVRMPEPALMTGDALSGAVQPGAADAVVGNPPFLGQLKRLTATPPQDAARLRALSGAAQRPYTDLSATFLQRAVTWVRPGGRVGLVQPQSVLAARDAAGVRAYVAGSCALEALWASDVPVFSASVLTCAVVLRRGAPQRAVRRHHGPGFAAVAPRTVSSAELTGEWSFLLAAGLGIPEVTLGGGAGRLSDIACCTADFRDQYYGLAPYVREAEEAVGRRAPLVTVGLVDPAELRWGRTATRFQKRRWSAPVVDLDALCEDTALAEWAHARLVPKVLVGTQGRVIEAVADPEGSWLPSVPMITVAAPAERLWHVLAVLLAPPVAAHAAARYAGTALTMRAVKLSARQVGLLPLPSDRALWDRGAGHVERAQSDPADRRRHLAEAGRVMCRAYGVGDESLEWWLARL